MNFPTPVLGFAACSGTGKTTLLKRLIPLLRDRGLRLGLVKHTHHDFDLDTPGKDSYELRKAGAAQVLVASHRRWAVIGEGEREQEPVLREMLERLDQSALDLILVEGFKHESLPKIELHRPSLGKPLIHPEDRDVIAVATDGGVLPGAAGLPVLDLDDVRAVADFVLSWMTQLRGTGLADPRQLLLDHYLWLRRYGYNDSHSGNGSVRDGDGFWITPTGACADTLTLEQLIRCPLDGPCPPGVSLDAPLHRAVYRRNPAAGAVLHSHGAHSVAVTLNGETFIPVDFEGQAYFSRVPVVDVPYAHYVETAPEAVADVLTGTRITVVRGHGVYTWGKTLGQAYKWTCSLELSAKTWLIARQAGTLPQDR